MSQSALPNIDRYVQQKIASGQFASREEFSREAIRVYRELETQHAELQAEVQRRIAQVERGEVGPLDIEAVKAEGRRRLAEGSLEG